jgi:hypothetical protein
MYSRFFVLVYLFIVSCNLSYYCNYTSYIGKYIIDKSLIKKDSILLKLVEEKNWDKVILIVEKENYFFESNDSSLKSCEGTWSLSSTDIEGTCFLHINQKNYKSTFSTDPFNIFLNSENKLKILPFRKVN